MLFISSQKLHNVTFVISLSESCFCQSLSISDFENDSFVPNNFKYGLIEHFDLQGKSLMI